MEDMYKIQRRVSWGFGLGETRIPKTAHSLKLGLTCSNFFLQQMLLSPSLSLLPQSKILLLTPDVWTIYFGDRFFLSFKSCFKIHKFGKVHGVSVSHKLRKPSLMSSCFNLFFLQSFLEYPFNKQARQTSNQACTVHFSSCVRRYIN